MNNFVELALEAYNIRPQRAESLWELSRYFREKGMNELAVLFAERGLEIPYPADDILFVEEFPYKWGLKQDYAISGFYVDRAKDRAHDICEELSLSREAPAHIRDEAWSNLFFFTKPLKSFAPSCELRRLPVFAPEGFHPCNPSICRIGDRMILNVRCVNYLIGDDGRYIFADPAIVITRNYLHWLSDDLNHPLTGDEIMSPTNLNPPMSFSVLGFEDLRLFTHGGELWGIASTQHFAEDRINQMVVAKISLDGINPRMSDLRVIHPNLPRQVEKNWMPITEPTWIRCIYSCDPLRIVDFDGFIHERPTPPIAAHHFGGSSQLIPFVMDMDEGYLCLIHERKASADGMHGQRNYQRRFVWFDKHLNMRKVSRRFFFGDGEGEFVCGMCEHTDGKRLVISYGVLDREVWLAAVDSDEVRKLLRPIGSDALLKEGIITVGKDGLPNHAAPGHLAEFLKERGSLWAKPLHEPGYQPQFYKSAVGPEQIYAAPPPMAALLDKLDANGLGGHKENSVGLVDRSYAEAGRREEEMPPAPAAPIVLVDNGAHRWWVPDVRGDRAIDDMRAGRIHDAAVFEEAKKHIKPGTAVIEVGAFLGQMTVLFSELVGPEGHVYAFEANPFFAGLIRRNLAENKCENVRVIGRPAWKDWGQALSYQEPNGRFESLASYGINPHDRGSLQSTTIDSYILILGLPVSFMKIDAQGSDLFAMMGARETIKKHQMPIIFEFEECFQDEFGTSIEQYDEFVKEIGYRVEKTIGPNWLIVPDVVASTWGSNLVSSFKEIALPGKEPMGRSALPELLKKAHPPQGNTGPVGTIGEPVAGWNLQTGEFTGLWAKYGPAIAPQEDTDLSPTLDYNRALRTKEEVTVARSWAEAKGWPIHPDRNKNWDCYLAIEATLKRAKPDDCILDAGGDTVSTYLPTLAKLGYSRLRSLNLLYPQHQIQFQSGILYQHGNIEHTNYVDGSFAFIACLSVIEHNVSTVAFLREARRILEPGGHLFVSTDYWGEPVETNISDWRIFGPAGISNLIADAASFGLILTSPMSLDVQDRVCSHNGAGWGGDFTFINMLFQKQ